MNSQLLKEQLTSVILPFWLQQIDHSKGGFIGQSDFNLVQDHYAEKSGVMHSRYLWSFSASFIELQEDSLKKAANHAYNFLTKYFWDNEFEGIYWSVKYDGEVKEAIKHLYAQSFAIYGLSEYYAAFNHIEALDYAKKLFYLIEEHCYKKELGGYYEEFSMDWQEKKYTQIAGHIEDAMFSTNTHLHLLEAYTNLYKIWPNELLKNRIQFLQSIFIDKIYHKDGYFQQFFNSNWDSLTIGLSFGHDIESAWLLERSLNTIKEENNELSKIIRAIEIYQLKNGLNHSLVMNYETNFCHTDTTKIWWVQAECLIGFYNAYQQTNNKEFKNIVCNTWLYVQNYFIDPRKNSEWFAHLKEDNPLELNISDSWKGPYHTVRMYLELIKRMENR